MTTGSARNKPKKKQQMNDIWNDFYTDFCMAQRKLMRPPWEAPPQLTDQKQQNWCDLMPWLYRGIHMLWYTMYTGEWYMGITCFTAPTQSLHVFHMCTFQRCCAAHVSQQLCTFHRSCARSLKTFVFNCIHTERILISKSIGATKHVLPIYIYILHVTTHVNYIYVCITLFIYIYVCVYVYHRLI